MSFAETLRPALKQADSTHPSPPPEADARLAAFTEACPLYANLLERDPALWAWLERPENRDERLRPSAFPAIWENTFAPADKPHEPDAVLPLLRRFRRQMCLRIAYREITGLGSLEDSMAELTHLAECVLRTCLELAWKRWEDRLGTPWDADLDQPARCCVLGLGKLGGGELNFCSDVDLIYVFEGDGHCRKNAERPTQTPNSEFFNRLFRDFSGYLTQRGPEGILYNLDLRLRPEGETGPLVRPMAAMTAYYWEAGQTWERLALLKARTVAGDEALGMELMEELHPFRYPRYPPPHLLPEVMGVKLRIEKEVLGADKLRQDIKNGPGGIREIEFRTQALQLVEAGRNPFLQTGATLEALSQLERYGLLDEEEAGFLTDAYTFLRRIENRLQMRRESRTHALPQPGEEARETLARTLGFEDTAAFEEKLEAVRKGVRERYSSFFGNDDAEEEIQEWTLFLGGKEPGPNVAARLEQWFGHREDREGRLRAFALGGRDHHITRENVRLFLDISRSFDAIFPKLASPLTALERVERFAGSHGARKQFFKACNASPKFLEALCLLFDRSEFIHRLLCQHPEIIEEVLYEAPRRQKSTADMTAEIGHLPGGEDFPRLLWLYVKAEQVRIAMGELLFGKSLAETVNALSDLADAAVGAVLARVDPEGELALIALGKYGSRELAYGSDLDMLITGPVRTEGKLAKKATAFVKDMQFARPLGRIFEVDLRLRPHGRDGALVVTLPAFETYHAGGGHAQPWERIMLTRARYAAGNEQLGRAFVGKCHELLHQPGLAQGDVAHLRQMRERIRREKARCRPPERAYKAGAGGLVAIEFAVQLLQVHHGGRLEALRRGSIADKLTLLAEEGLLPGNADRTLPEAYAFLRTVELHLRRDAYTGISEIPAEERPQRRLAHWMGFADAKAFFEALRGHFQAVEAAADAVFATLEGQ